MWAFLRGLRLLQKLELFPCTTFPFHVLETKHVLKMLFGGEEDKGKSLQVSKLF